MIKLSEDKELVELVKEQLKQNDGYCPCKILHIPQNKCMCEDFRQQKTGQCHCGLYIKE